MPSVKRNKKAKILAAAIPAAIGPEYPLPDRFREAFVQHLLANPDLSEAEVYREVAADPILTMTHRRSARLIMQSSEVRARMMWLQQQAAARSEISRADMQAFLAAVIRTPVGELTPEHRIAQKVEYHDNGAVKKVEGPDKLSAAAQLCKMNGWDRPEGDASPIIAAEAVVFAVLRGQISTQ